MPEFLGAVSTLIGALAWPLVVVGIAVGYRRPLHDLLDRMRTFDGPGGVSFTADALTVATTALVKADRRHSLAMRRYVDERSDLISKLDRPPRVLWVDDQPSNNFYERSALEALGFWVQLSTNNDDAWERISAASYDVVISDMRRPPVEDAGFQLLSKLRQNGNKTRFAIYSGDFSNWKRNYDEAVRRGALGCSNMAGGLVEMLIRALRDILSEPEAEARQATSTMVLRVDAGQQPQSQ